MLERDHPASNGTLRDCQSTLPKILGNASQYKDFVLPQHGVRVLVLQRRHQVLCEWQQAKI